MTQLATGTAAGGTAYLVELAFDWDADPHPTFGFHLLQIGLVGKGPNETGAPNPASFASGPKVGDCVSFLLYDNSDGAAGDGNPPYRVLNNAEAWFNPTRSDQGSTGPFGMTTGLSVRPRSGPGPRRDSVTFGKSLPNWPLFAESGTETPGAFQLQHNGRFYLSARVSLSNGQETRVYRVDPEMIISNTGSSGGGG